tara:strand:- start:353 stop:829 length:477 start_codon:yes stop_codon:yes gene_type:complete
MTKVDSYYSHFWSSLRESYKTSQKGLLPAVVVGAVGGIIGLGGGVINLITNYPSQPFALERYYDIEEELDSFPARRLRDARLNIPNLEKLEAERDKIISDPNFAGVSDRYKLEVEDYYRTTGKLCLGGAVNSLLVIVGCTLLRRRERKYPSVGGCGVR